MRRPLDQLLEGISICVASRADADVAAKAFRIIAGGGK
jgi:hypothetical protein